MKSPSRRDLELTLESIRADVTAAATELSEKLGAAGRAEFALQELRSAHQAESDAMERRRQELDERERQVIAGEAAFGGDLADRKAKVAETERQQREASKELARLNGWIVAAQDDRTKREAELKELDGSLAEKRALIDGIERLKDEHADHELRRDRQRLESSFETDDAAARLRAILDEADAAERRTLAALDATAEAIAARDAAIKEKDRICADLEIYIRRVEEKYQEAFPGLRMPL